MMITDNLQLGYSPYTYGHLSHFKWNCTPKDGTIPMWPLGRGMMDQSFNLCYAHSFLCCAVLCHHFNLCCPAELSRHFLVSARSLWTKDDPWKNGNKDPFNNRNKDPFNNRNSPSPSPSPPSSDYSESGGSALICGSQEAQCGEAMDNGQWGLGIRVCGGTPKSSQNHPKHGHSWCDFGTLHRLNSFRMEIASDLGPVFGKHLVMQSCWIHTDNWRFPIYGWPRIQIYLL